MMHVVSVQYVNLLTRASLQNIFKIPMHSREMEGGLKFHDNEKWFKWDILHFFLIVW